MFFQVLLLLGSLGIFVSLAAVSSEVAALMVLGLVIWQAAEAGPLPGLFSVGPLLVHPADLVSVSLAITAAMRFIRAEPRSRPTAPALAGLLLTALLAVSFLRGVMDFGAQPAGVGLRPYAYLISTAAYFGGTPLRARGAPLLAGLWGVASLALIAIAVTRWTALLGGGSIPLSWQAQGLFRVLDGAQTLFLAQTLVVTLYVSARMPGRWPVRALTYATATAVMTMQQRTVWVASAVTLVGVLLLEARLRRTVITALGAGLLGTVFILLLFTIVPPSPGSTPKTASTPSTSIATGAQGTTKLGAEHFLAQASNPGTFRWRVLGWLALVRDQTRDPLAVVVGRPFGSGFERTFVANGKSITVSVGPHNAYLRTFLRVGVLGLGCALLFYGLLLRNLLRRRSQTETPSTPAWERALPALLFMQLVFGLAYAMSIEQGIVLGLALASAAGPRQEPSYPRDRLNGAEA